MEKEIVAFSPENKPITSSDLAKATIALNSRIRNRDLSSYEIMFSREQHTGKNIQLDDESLSASKMKLKEENHKHTLVLEEFSPLKTDRRRHFNLIDLQMPLFKRLTPR